jgi:polysaccharide export outer membrane protein
MNFHAARAEIDRMLRHARVVCRGGAAISLMALAACSTLGSSGPTSRGVLKGHSEALADADIRVIDVNGEVARRLAAAGNTRMFSDVLGDGAPMGAVIGQGDVLDITIWEAPPAALFGVLNDRNEMKQAGALEIARSTDMPQQMVDIEGTISLPFVGRLHAAGKTPRQLEVEIRSRLQGIANKPQVSVGIARNATANVTVVGEVTTNSRVPLTPRGERLLDVLAMAGGVRQPVEKTTIQITRGPTLVSLPLGTVIRDPRQNIHLQPDDVVTAIFQPYSFTAMGAIGTNAEISFEATGITLAQAIGRMGGLQDNRADVKGVFLFRLEQPTALGTDILHEARTTPDGKVPVIYRVNLADPGSFFVAQSFAIRDKDVLYVSNAPGVDLQKFVTIISQMAFSVIGISNAATGN